MVTFERNWLYFETPVVIFELPVVPPKYTRTGIFGIKICHLASLALSTL
jgi:hypothetical protein